MVIFFGLLVFNFIRSSLVVLFKGGFGSVFYDSCIEDLLNEIILKFDLVVICFILVFNLLNFC